MMAEIVTFCVSCKQYLLFVSLFSMQWKLIVYVLQQESKRSNSVLLLVKWEKKKPNKIYFKKNHFFILFIRTSDLFFRHEKINDD